MMQPPSDDEIGRALMTSWRTRKQIAKSAGMSERHLRRLIASGKFGGSSQADRLYVEAQRLPTNIQTCDNPAHQQFLINLVNSLIPVLAEVAENTNEAIDPQMAAGAAGHIRDKLCVELARRQQWQQERNYADRDV